MLADLDARGISIRGWARANGVKASAVYHLLSGKNKGRRGEAHRAAVLLGLKSGAIEDQQGESEHGGL
ncbi:hypothetical protein [Vulcaniibacterium tengchongense]|uniref:hypothetical protein n=1 Tax=Vulcaniibacterium tengchongense TaxID=1273429 RepID=UPI0018F6A974|nr:hypothetical protein [Vulcaniibacterium tengchongense]